MLRLCVLLASLAICAAPGQAAGGDFSDSEIQAFRGRCTPPLLESGLATRAQLYNIPPARAVNAARASMSPDERKREHDAFFDLYGRLRRSRTPDLGVCAKMFQILTQQ